MLAPLLDVHELVRDQPDVVLVAAPHEDPPAERHRAPRPGVSTRHDDDPGPRAVDARERG